VYEQAAPWFTVNVRPAMVIVPFRDPEAGATWYCTLPLPVCEPAPAKVSHGTLLDTVHAQPPAVETSTRPLPPVAGTVTLSGDTANAHAPP
jgi:hypothetical protein